MIARYSRPVLRALWDEDSKLSRMLAVELAATEALEACPDSPIPPGTSERLRARAASMGPLDQTRIAALEAVTQHDVLAFLIHIEERLGDEARFLHFGLTSSDVLDTALALVLRDATDVILQGLRETLLPALADKASAYAHVPMIGRSHGMFAEPVTVGLLFAGSHAELVRAQQRLLIARQQIAVGKLSGAVGVYGSGGLSPAVEKAALSRLGLLPETLSTQVVPRDRHAALLQALVLLACGIERLALNLRHGQRSEVGELQEAFASGQGGSSAMPHKKNPISAENLCGLSRLLRAQASAALENIALWHERDISHSSVERVILPDVTMLADYMVQRAARLVGGITVHEKNLAHNLRQSAGLYASEKVMLALVQTGLSRRAAYELVQRHAMEVAQVGRTASAAETEAPLFLQRLLADEAVTSRLSEATLLQCFDLTHHLRHVPALIERALHPGDDAGVVPGRDRSA